MKKWLIVAGVLIVVSLPLLTNGEREVSVLNFGDIMFDRGVRRAMEKGKNPFEFIGPIEQNFMKADFIIANLEGPIIETARENCQIKPYSFQFPLAIPKLLAENGFNLLNIANNHSFDCYQAGVESTKRALEGVGIGYMGDRTLESSYVVKEIKNKKIAFVGIDTFTAPIAVGEFYPLIRKLKLENDYVVIDIHWGIEYEPRESEVQIQVAHALIDSGADVVFGHHPHVVEPVEVYKNRVIFYSLGNFIFDQLTPETNLGLAASVTFSDGKISTKIFPFNIVSTQPKIMNSNDTQQFCKEFLEDITPAKDCGFEL
jgi:gamma-polyglutamate biosynthesis protein CapA